MGRSANQKRKILLIERMLEATDELHPITMKEMIEELAKAGIQAERKSIYGDLEELRNVGMKICFRKGKPMGYYLSGNSQSEANNPEEEAACTVQESAETEEEKVPGEEWPENIKYWEQEEGEYKEIQIKCRRSAFPAVRSRYGENCRILKEEEKYISASVAEVPGNIFYGWLVSQGGAVRPVKPKETAKEYRKLLKKILESYK